MPIKQREALTFVSTIEESMVKGFPFTIPAEYANLPQLLVGGGPLAGGDGAWPGIWGGVGRGMRQHAAGAGSGLS